MLLSREIVLRFSSTAGRSITSGSSASEMKYPSHDLMSSLMRANIVVSFPGSQELLERAGGHKFHTASALITNGLRHDRVESPRVAEVVQQLFQIGIEPTAQRRE